MKQTHQCNMCGYIWIGSITCPRCGYLNRLPETYFDKDFAPEQEYFDYQHNEDYKGKM